MQWWEKYRSNRDLTSIELGFLGAYSEDEFAKDVTLLFYEDLMNNLKMTLVGCVTLMMDEETLNKILVDNSIICE